MRYLILALLLRCSVISGFATRFSTRNPFSTKGRKQLMARQMLGGPLLQEMLGSYLTNNKDLQKYVSKEEMKKKQLEFEESLTAIEQREVELAKDILLAEKERERILDEARKSGIDLSEVTANHSRLKESASVFLEKSNESTRAYRTPLFSEDPESKSASPVLESKEPEALADNMSVINRPAVTLGGIFLAAVGARVALQNREEKQKELNGMRDVENFVDEVELLLREIDGKLEMKDGTDETNSTPTNHSDGKIALNESSSENEVFVKNGDAPQVSEEPEESQTLLVGEDFEQIKPDEDSTEVKEYVKSNITLLTNENVSEYISGGDKFAQEEVVGPKFCMEDDATSVSIRDGSIKFFESKGSQNLLIKVIGVGDGGSYAIESMVDGASDMFEYWAINSDAEAMISSMEKSNTLFIGKGSGKKGDVEAGIMAALDSKEDIAQIVKRTDVCFVVSTLGGGTGSGAAPVISRISKQSGAFTIAVVTTPFPFEGRKRIRRANESIELLGENADAVIVISNSNVLRVIPDDISLEASFGLVDAILKQSVFAISNLFTKTGVSNSYLENVQSVLESSGISAIGIGNGFGKSALQDATNAAFNSPLLDEKVKSARGIFVNVSGGELFSTEHVDLVLQIACDNSSQDAKIKVVSDVDKSLRGDSIRVTVCCSI